jgi:hypothetical protein
MWWQGLRQHACHACPRQLWLLCVTALAGQAQVVSCGLSDAAASPALPLLLLLLLLCCCCCCFCVCGQAGVVKAHMLLLAHLERLGSQVPPQLQADYK